MRDESHRTSSSTWIATILKHVTAHRRAMNWSRETFAQRVVEQHEHDGRDATTGMRFDPPTRDVFERQKVNADRIFRWLDDASKDHNLLPVNFLPSLLAALPAPLRLALLGDLLHEVSVAPRMIVANDTALDPVGTLRELLRESGEAQEAVAELIDGATREELEEARTQLQQSADATARALQAVEGEIRRRRRGK